MIAPTDYFDLDEASEVARRLFEGVEPVWDVLDKIRPFLEENLSPNIAPLKAKYPDFVERTVVLFEGRVVASGFELRPGDATKGKFQVIIDGQEAPGAVVIYGGACLPDEDVELGPGVVIETGAVIKGPSLIGPQTEVRQGAYVRGSCLIGSGCVVGHVSEFKNAVLLDRAKAGHFAYVGDSILGLEVNLGAGCKLANLKIKSGPVLLRAGDQTFRVSRRKFGAIIGDGSELGCNTVTNPGCLLGPRTLVVPNSTLPSGIHPPRTIFHPR